MGSSECLGKQPLIYPPCAALSLAVEAGGQKVKHMRGSRHDKLLSFTGLLERTYTAKELRYLG